MYRVQIFNSIAEVGVQHLSDHGYMIGTAMDSPDGYVMRSHNLWEATLPESLKAVSRAGAGVNNIPIEHCSGRGIVVFNTPGANANSVKELVLCGMLLSSRGVSEGIAWSRSLRGKDVGAQVEKGKKHFKGTEIKGKTLGVIGLGSIGVAVANAGSALGMNVVGFDPFISVTSAWGLASVVAREESLLALISKADYISIHAPLNDRTRDLISEDQFAIMKPGARLLNFARGPLVKNEALLQALDQGKLGRYVTDFPDDTLVGHDKVIPVPHLGASTVEAEENCAVMAVQQLSDYLERGVVINSVNFPTVKQPPPPGAHRIQIVNRNEPSMISQLTGVLGVAGINIVNLINKGQGAVAYTVIDVYDEINDSIMHGLRSIDGVVRARCIKAMS